ncbi:MAG: peroxiredoxin family protein [Flavobacteriaceae bacterium]
MKKTSILVLILFIGFIISCDSNDNPQLHEGFIKSEISLQGTQLPFVLELKGNPVNEINLINGEESFPIENFSIDSGILSLPLHIFDSELKAKITENGLKGSFTKNYIKDYTLPFEGTYAEDGNRVSKTTTSTHFDGTYRVNFTEEDGSSYPAIGIFQTVDGLFKGTFLTETGDYRYLEGYANDQQMQLYTFDGNHAFIFDAERSQDGRLHGSFYSGKSYHATWDAVPDSEAKLGDANSLTYLKKGYDRIEFAFPDLNGNTVQLSDSKFQNKVVLLQIFGTWCPNCMDETIFYSDWMSKHQGADVEILGLAYEAKDDFDYAVKRVKTMKQRLNVPYDFVIAGTSNKAEAAKTLPMLNKIISFPTTIFIDKKGEVRKIHTGFTGPATGIYYEKYVEEFNSFMNELLNE